MHWIKLHPLALQVHEGRALIRFARPSGVGQQLQDRDLGNAHLPRRRIDGRALTKGGKDLGAAFGREAIHSWLRIETELICLLVWLLSIAEMLV